MTCGWTSAMAMGEMWVLGVSERRWCCTPEGFETAAGALSDRMRRPDTRGLSTGCPTFAALAASVGKRESGIGYPKAYD